MVLKNVIPAILEIDDAREEVEYILEIERGRGNKVSIITPFYYQLLKINIGEYRDLIFDPNITRVSKLKYRVPSIDELLYKLNTSHVDESSITAMLNDVKNIAKNFLKDIKWSVKWLLLDNLVDDMELINSLSNASWYMRLEDIHGVIIGRSSVEDVIDRNQQSLYELRKAYGETYVKIQSLIEQLRLLKNIVESVLWDKYQREHSKIANGFNMLLNIINSNISDLERKFNSEMNRLNEKYNSLISELKYRVTLIDRRIEVLNKRLKYTRDPSYLKKQLKELRKKRRILLERIKNSERRFRLESINLKKLHTKMINIERSRINFYESELPRLKKEYGRIRVRIDNLVNEIESILNNVLNVINNEYSRILNYATILRSSSLDVFYIKGYIVVGVKGREIYTTSILKNRSDMKIVRVKPIYNYLVKNGYLDHLRRIDPFTLDKYNVLKHV